MVWDIDNHLQKNEKIIFEEKPSFFGFKFALLLGAIFLILSFISFFYFFLSLFFFSLIFLNRETHKYYLTNKRIISRKGVISENFKSASFNHVTSINVRRGLFGLIFNYGNLEIKTSGSFSKSDFVWLYVSDPIVVKNEIENKIK